MTIAAWLKLSEETLRSNNISTARLDAELLLSELLEKDRTWLHTHPDHILQRSDLRILDKQISRRAKHEPVAYIRGRQEFYGREFIVSPDTLTPRPETETMVEMALQILQKQDTMTVADIGSGSGCIVISLKLESNKDSSFIGYDISKPALEIARKNARNFDSNVTFKQTDITNEAKQAWQNAELIVANLPYVPTDFKINTAATHEPDFAIFGGDDGLDYYRIMFAKLSNKTKYVLTESLPPQHEELTVIAKKAGFKLQKTQDLIQQFAKE